VIGEWKWLAARAHLTMIEIADGLTSEFRRMMRVFDKAGDAALCSEGLTWGGVGVMSTFSMKSLSMKLNMLCRFGLSAPGSLRKRQS